MQGINNYFNQRPEREFHLTEIPVSELAAVSAAGWIAGAATCTSHPFNPSIPHGCKKINCIVRRADPTAGRPLPGVFLMDGVPSLAPPKGSAGAEEQFCEHLWGIAQVAESIGVSFVDLMHDPTKSMAAMTGSLLGAGPSAP